MQLTSRQEFPADPAAVHAMVTDPAFLRHAAQQLGATRAEVDAAPRRTRVEADVETPGEVRAFLGPTITVAQEMVWTDAAPDGSRDATVVIDVMKAPATLRGTARLEPTASGSAITYAGEFTVNVPFVGGTVEKQTAPLILDTIEVQGRVGREWLAR